MKINVKWERTYSVDFKDDVNKDAAINAATTMIRCGGVTPKTDSMEIVNNFHELPSDLAEQILSNVVNCVREEMQNTDASIKKSST